MTVTWDLFLFVGVVPVATWQIAAGDNISVRPTDRQIDLALHNRLSIYPSISYLHLLFAGLQVGWTTSWQR